VARKRKSRKRRKPDIAALVREAGAAAQRAYAPYSRFRVGAALLGTRGRVYTGVNVESASYGLTVCAERAALSKAVAEGCRSFKAVAVVEKKQGVVTPCGACRQALYEFSPRMKVAVKRGRGVSVMPLKRLLPKAFDL
jgi:cytidine deaminase